MKTKRKIMAFMLSIIIMINIIPFQSIVTYADHDTSGSGEEKISEIHEEQSTEITIEDNKNELEDTSESEKREDSDIMPERETEENPGIDIKDEEVTEEKIEENKEENTEEITENATEDTVENDKINNKEKEKKEKIKKEEEIAPTFDHLYDGVSIDGLDFSSCELLIATTDISIFTADTEVVSGYNDIYLTRFTNEEQTKSAYTYYYTKSDFVDVNSVIKANGKDDDRDSNDGHGEADLSEINMGDDAISCVSSAEPSDYSGCVALIDTGAVNSHVIEAVSVIGDLTSDDNGHGTKMADAMVTADPNVKILSIKALDSTAVGKVSDVYAAIEYAIKAHVNVINLSMCSVVTQDSDVLKEAISDALEQGIIVVASAGNNGRDASYYTPAGINGVITAGACDEYAVRLASSNYGPLVDYYIVASSTSDAAAKLSAYILIDGKENVSKRTDVYLPGDLNNNQKKENERADKHYIYSKEMLDDILLKATATPPEGSGFPHYINDVTVEIYQTSAKGKTFAGYMVSANVPKTSRYYNKLQIGSVQCYCAKYPDRDGGCADPGPGKHTISNLKFTYVSSSKGVATYSAISNVDGQSHDSGYQRMELTIKLSQQNSFISIEKLLQGNPKNRLKDVYFDVYDNKNASGKPLGYMKTSSSGGVAHNIYEDTDFKTMTHSTSDGLKGSLDLVPGTTVYLFEVGQGTSYGNAKNKAPSDSKYKTDAAHEAGQPNVIKYAIDILPDDSRYIARYSVKTTSTKAETEKTLENPVEEFVFIYKKDEYGFELAAQYQIYGTTQEVNLSGDSRNELIDKIKKASGSKLVTTITVKDGYGIGDVSSYKRDHLDDDRYYYAVEVDGSQDSVHKASFPFRLSSRTYKAGKGEFGYNLNTDIENHYYYKVGVYKYDDEGKTVQATFDIYATEKNGAVSGGKLLGSVVTNSSTGYGVYDVTKDYIGSVVDGKPHYYYAVETATDNEHDIQNPKEVVLKTVRGNTSDFALASADYVKKLNPVIKPIKPVIGTTAAVVETNSKMLAQKGCDEKIDYKNQTIKDTISYQNLKNNTTYTFLTELMVVNKNNEVAAYMKDGKALRQVSIIKTGGNGVKTTYSINGKHSVDIKGVDPSGLEEEQKKLVVYETLYLGEYKTVEELDTAIANKTIKKSYDGYEAMSFFPVEHKDKNDDFQTVRPIDLQTAASYGMNLDRVSYPDEQAKIIDKVYYTGLEIGKEYTIKGTLHIKPDSKDEMEIELKDKDGNPIVVENTFTAKTNEGFEELMFEFDASLLKGKTVVVFEDLIYNDMRIAVHRDIKDENESIHFPEFKTSARNALVSDSDDEASKEVCISSETSIIDKVNYLNLLANRNYLVKGVLMDKETGEVMKDSQGKEIRGEKSFSTPEVKEIIDSVSPNGIDYKLEDGTVMKLSADHADYSCTGYVEVTFEGYDFSTLAGKTGVVYEEIYLIQEGSEYLVGEHKDIDDVDQFIYIADIRTSATDKLTGIKIVPYDTETVIRDVVTYKNLIPGKEYILNASLHVKNNKDGKYKDGEILQDKNSKDIAVSVKFTPEEKNGTVTVEIPLNTNELRSMELVVYEEMTNSLGILVAEHKDIGDSDQTVTIPGGYTNAKDRNSDTQIAEFDKDITIVDTITYENFEPGRKYKVTGTLYSKQTGSPIKSGENPITATVEFTPENKNGTVDVPFSFNTKYLSGVAIVAFEDVIYTTENGKEISVFSHQDINSKEQTIQIKQGDVPKEKKTESKTTEKVKTEKVTTEKVVVEKKTTSSKSPKTGDALPLIPIIVILTASLSGIALIAREKKHNKKDR